MNQMIQVLKDSHLSFRRIPSRKSAVFFCEKKDQITFDIEMTQQSQVKAWSYIAEGIPKKYHQRHWEFRVEDEEDTAIGLEVTNEGILSPFFRQKMISSEDDAEIRAQEIRMVKRLESFICFLKGLTAVMKEEGLRVINEPSDDCAGSCHDNEETVSRWSSDADEKDICRDDIFIALTRKLDLVFGSHQDGERDTNAELPPDS